MFKLNEEDFKKPAELSVPLGSIDKSSIIDGKKRFKIEIDLKSAKKGTELLRLLPAVKDVQYEYRIKKGNTRIFSISRNFIDLSSKQQLGEIALSSLILNRSIQNPHKFHLEIVGVQKNEKAPENESQANADDDAESINKDSLEIHVFIHITK